MFGKLKEKLKSWFKSSTEKIEETAEKIEEKPIETKKEKRSEKIKKIKQKEEELIQEAPKTIKEADEEIRETQELAEEVEKLEEKEKEKEIEIEQLEKETQQAKKPGFFSRLKASFSYKITAEEFDSIFDDLEMLLLENNVALEVVEDIRKKLSEKLIGREIKKDNLGTEIKTELKNSLNELLIEPDNPLEIIQLKKEKPFVILFFGINGTGKTTSIAKLAHLLKKNNLSVVLAAADTFRAASIEQIQIHADKLKVPLVKHTYGSDPSSVGFDAIKYAKAHKIDVVLIDTAGRMHTKTNLLAEMEKICRVTKPDLKIFVAESIAGNDATEQAKSFHEMIDIDGSILSKADIDEKGGTIISVSHTTHKPVFYLGTGQEYKDLKLFNKQEFIESLGL
jgi:fused signal recognition particle receptor